MKPRSCQIFQSVRGGVERPFPEMSEAKDGFSQAHMDVLVASPGKTPANRPGTKLGGNTLPARALKYDVPRAQPFTGR